MPDCNIESELIGRAKNKAHEVTEKLKTLNEKKMFNVVLAESCTAGLISSLLACVPGASRVLWGSFVCYAKEAKVSMLGLNDRELDANGLVSRETACSMAVNALRKSSASIAASVTGLAGPSTDGSEIPVGTIWIATASRGGAVKVKEFHFTGSRNAVRIQAAISVFEQILDII
jgi:nicotinamide-nucleotide amidase